MRRALRGSAAVSREQGARSRERMRLRMEKRGAETAQLAAFLSE
jgi:hypothetical protein